MFLDLNCTQNDSKETKISKNNTKSKTQQQQQQKMIPERQKLTLGSLGPFTCLCPGAAELLDE